MNTMSDTKPKIAYFGGAPLGVPVFEILCEHGLSPTLVVTAPDRRSGRGQQLTPNPLKRAAIERGIEIFQPETLKDENLLSPLTDDAWDLFVVVAYPQIFPKWLIETPAQGTINLHPSLLPKYRGVSPIRSAILADDRHVGVSIITLDEKMDHGPILAKEPVTIPEVDWPIDGAALDTLLAQVGGALLARTIPEHLASKSTPREQEHDAATYTKKFTKADMELSIDPHALPNGTQAYETLLKIRGFSGMPGTFFFHNGTRIKIAGADIAPDGTLEIHSVIPEGRSEVPFTTWLASQ